MYCKHCGNKMEEDALFCTSCGCRKDAEEKALYCESCGTKISEGALFCTTCGNKIVIEQTAASPEKDSQENIGKEKASSSTNEEQSLATESKPEPLHVRNSISGTKENAFQNVPDTATAPVTRQAEEVQDEIVRKIDTKENDSTLLTLEEYNCLSAQEKESYKSKLDSILEDKKTDADTKNNICKALISYGYLYYARSKYSNENNQNQGTNSEEPKAAEEKQEIIKEESQTSNAQEVTAQNNAETENTATDSTAETKKQEVSEPTEPINQTPYTSYQSSSRSGLVAICCIGWIAFVIALVCAINNYGVADRYEAKYNSLTKEYESLTGRYNNMQAKYNEVLNAGPWANITRVYDQNGSTDLYRNKITYLYFDYKIYSSSELNGVKVKIIDPWGSVLRGTGSPSGYSYTIDGWQSPFQYQYGTGYGNDYPGTYSRGNWKIELWYNDLLIARKVVKIK